MGYQFYRVSVEEHVATVTMDRPPVNAFSRQMYEEGVHLFQQLGSDPEVWVVVLTGAGERAFCAGNDVAEFQEQDPAAVESHIALTSEFFRTLYECAVPVIGAINSHALGTGCAIASSCDVLVAARNATFGFPEIRVGAFAGGSLLRRLVPEHKARWLVLSGERVSAEELYRLGVVEGLVEVAELLPTAQSLAKTLLSVPPLGIRIGKKALNETEYMPLWEASKINEKYFGQIRMTEDSVEAARAFLEKRTPRFKGR